MQWYQRQQTTLRLAWGRRWRGGAAGPLRLTLSLVFHFHDEPTEWTWCNRSWAPGFVMVLDFGCGGRQRGAGGPIRQWEATIKTQGSLLCCQPQTLSCFSLFFPSCNCRCMDGTNSGVRGQITVDNLSPCYTLWIQTW